MPQSRGQWVYAPEKASPSKMPEALKREIETKANDLIETVLKPLHLKPPEEKPQFNYIESFYTKWYRKNLVDGSTEQFFSTSGRTNPRQRVRRSTRS